MKEKHFVSIIIPALNEEKYIPECFMAIRDIDFPKNRYEIILVDNGSQDRTTEIANSFGARVLYKSNGTIGSVRNYGARNAIGDILGFIDADCKVDKDWLTNAIQYFECPKIAAVGSRLSHLTSTWVAKCWSLIHAEKIELGETEWLPSGNMVVSRKCFQEVNGFDERLTTSEDYDVCLRLRSKGYKIISDPKISSVHLNPPQTLIEFYKKEKWHGQEMLKIFFSKNRKVSRAFLYAMFNLFCITGILVGAAISLIYLNHSLLLISTSVFLLAPLFLAIKTTRRSKSYRYILPLGLMFMTYGLARSACLISMRGMGGAKGE